MQGGSPEAKWTFDGGGEGQGTLAEAVAAAYSEQDNIEIQLLSNIELNDSWSMPALGKGNEVVVDGNGHTISRGTCETGFFVVSESDTYVTLKNITLDGGARWNGTDPATRRNEGTWVSTDAPLMRVGDAGASNVQVTLDQGAVLQNNAFEAVFAGVGVQVAANGTLEMLDGSVIQNNAVDAGSYACLASGVYVETDAAFLMKGGLISGNYIFGWGSGVYTEGKMEMKGGSISGNYVKGSGGGVYIDATGTFLMEDGSISQNTAEFGGGITLFKGKMTLYGGVITDNKAGTGGGMMIYYSPVTVGDSIYVYNNTDLNGRPISDIVLANYLNEKLVLGKPFQANAKIGVAKWNGAQENAVALEAASGVTEENITDAMAFVESEDKYGLVQVDKTLVFSGNASNYTVTFDSNEGTEVLPLADVKHGSSLTKPENPQKAGYTFAGWYQDPAFKFIWDFDNDQVKHNLTLYAKWNRNYIPSYYQVTFDSRGGTPVEGYSSVREYTTIQEPGAPTYDGYTFLGWYRDPAGETPWDFTKDIVNENLTLYAKWEALPLPRDMDLKLVQKTTDTVTLSWDPVENAEGYSLWYKAEGQEKYELAKLITGTDTLQWTLTDLEPGTIYYFRGKAWRQFGTKRAYGGSVRAIRATTYPETAVIESVTADRRGRLKVRLAKAAVGAERYAFCYSKKASFVPYKIGIRTSYTVRTMPDELSPGTYWVKVRSYRMLDGKCYYGGWSEAVEATVKRK